ncbi:MAG: hypothetical protein COA82_10945 [Alkaliphilus sp.]|nr:hypothetical protein [bacterium AH-315-G05]MBN4074884.1 hypothetical protein [bacterium AH-315-E09]PHS30851.1 MAG: hypothetical protein COA82_10945 [Alkaliphilus sp.]
MHKKANVENFYFWENKIRNSDDILIGNEEQIKITKETPIIYIGILDKKKGILKSGWSCHKNIDVALGFLTYVFLPAALLTWGARDVDGFFIPLSDFDTVISEITKGRDSTPTEIKSMRDMNEKLLDSFMLGKTEKWRVVNSFCENFNDYFDRNSEKKLFVKVFNNSNEIVDFVIKDIENEFMEVIEEEIDMSIKNLRFMCENVYEEVFINRTFIEQLNQKIPIWF